jgi:GrpB-like predicted nucleotidyltransferase (UPF0157 family)
MPEMELLVQLPWRRPVMHERTIFRDWLQGNTEERDRCVAAKRQAASQANGAAAASCSGTRSGPRRSLLNKLT